MNFLVEKKWNVMQSNANWIVDERIRLGVTK